MSATESQRAWIKDVLGLSFPALSARDGSGRQRSSDDAPAPRQPFQIFVKGLDDVTFMITLPNGHETKIGDLQRLIQDRTGIAPDEQNLTTGARSFNSQHADLPVSDYELRRNQTLSLQGRLKGGFGERAAIADVILKGLRRGNVLSDIEDSNGRTTAIARFHRSLFGGLPKLKEGESRHPVEQYLENLAGDGEALLSDVADEAVKLMDQGQEGFDSTAAKQNWLRDHAASIRSMVYSRGKAANCADYAEIVYTNLLSKTTGQAVYQVSMVGKEQDHRFVVTSPTNHGNRISALMADPDAMVADGWWQNRICTFAQFIQGKDDDDTLLNPYGASLTAKDLEIRAFADATGQDLDEQVAAFAADKIDALYEKYEQNIALGATVYEQIAEDMSGIFGESGDDWNTTKPDDARSEADLYRMLDLVYQNGGTDQWVEELKSLKDRELVPYLEDTKADLADKVQAIKQACRDSRKMLDFIKEQAKDEWLPMLRTLESPVLGDYLIGSKLTPEELSSVVHDETIKANLEVVDPDFIDYLLSKAKSA